MAECSLVTAMRSVLRKNAWCNAMRVALGGKRVPNACMRDVLKNAFWKKDLLVFCVPVIAFSTLPSCAGVCAMLLLGLH